MSCVARKSLPQGVLAAESGLPGGIGFASASSATTYVSFIHVRILNAKFDLP